MTKTEKNNLLSQLVADGWIFTAITKRRSGVVYNSGYSARHDKYQMYLQRTNLEKILIDCNKMGKQWNIDNPPPPVLKPNLFKRILNAIKG